jgi:hypothetical protein
MIEAQTQHSGENTQQTETPQTITISMILADLDNGIDRNGIKDKYSLDTWEVKQMFEHPNLKGKKAKKKRKLSFNFVDDTTTVDPNQTSIPVETTPAEDFHNRADLRTQDAIDNDVDVHQEASMIVEATPELQEKFEQEDDTDEFDY